MRIIKQENEVEIVCSCCKSELAYTNRDIKQESSSSVQFISNGIQYVKCPICSNDIYIK